MATETVDTHLDPARWLDEHGDLLYRYALARVRDAEVAEDLVQETFVAALRGQRNFAGRSSERTWLVGILKNKIVDHLRRKWREQPLSELEPAEQAEDFLDLLFTRGGRWKEGAGRWGDDPAAGVRAADFQRVLAACLEGLPGRLADVFILREIEQLPSDEVRQVLNISPTNLWAMLYRARMRLRGCLEANWLGHAEGKR
ncbi:MAG TPA: sigma-70 family RNA polymerase sigma factor [Candidatus Sumerlaeota bacterium]|nr:sigma-70 family RNA polymerase sigma factor [Candidatus Sumerlaeota bacterium]